MDICETVTKKCALVLSGGGVKGCAYIGFFEHLENNQSAEFDAYAGTSIGALFCLLKCLKYTSAEMKLLIEDYWLLFHPELRFKNIPECYALNNMSLVYKFLKEIIERRSLHAKITFEDLMMWTNTPLHITLTNLNSGDVVYASYLTHPKWSVIDAVIGSMSLPILFPPKIIDNEMYVDGGLVDNFPVDPVRNTYEIVSARLMNAPDEPLQQTNMSFFQFCIRVIKLVMQRGHCSDIPTYRIYTKSEALAFPNSIEQVRELILTGTKCEKTSL